MATPIPVRIAERDFRSINQARIHFRDILHKYQPGQAVSEDDGAQVAELLASSDTSIPADRPLGVRVVQGNYGRRCFANVSREKDVQTISIIRSVKSCTVPAPSTTVAKLPVPDGQTPTP